MKHTKNVLFLLIFVFSTANSAYRQDLGGQWTVRGTTPEEQRLKGMKDEIVEAATVPGGIYSDLMAAGVIGDIFYGNGVEDYRWIGRNDWTYTTTFTVDEDLFNIDTINLVFEGLDTFATILVNDQEIAQTGNMFVRYVFDVKQYLNSGENTIEVRFSSAVRIGRELKTEQDANYTVPPECQPNEYHGECNVNQVRKMQASFSWDWGPSFPSVGIWKEVYLEAFSSAAIRYVLATPSRLPSSLFWILEVTTYFAVGSTGTAQGYLENYIVMENGTTFAINLDVNVTATSESEASFTVILIIPNEYIQLWWPNGYGDQILYTLFVTFSSGDEDEVRTQSIGFRTVELLQEEEVSGLNFYFKVNDIPIFAKGANEIPISVLPERGQDPEAITRVLQTAKDSNMNMIRVWGGGVYESDFFYQKTSELGILVWQDFMFACALYPTRFEYLKTVTDEVRHQVRRLHSYPSVMLWSGNNENEGVLQDRWFPEINDNYEQYRSDYVQLYNGTIRGEVLKIIPEALFILSSPTNGLKSEADGGVSDGPGNSLYGDVHFYDYVRDSWDPATFPIPRFASEYGYQSMPTIDTWLTTTADLNGLAPEAAFLDNRQHHPEGNSQNLALIEIQMALPDATSEHYIEAFVYFSQISQAQSIKVETEHYRSFTGRLDRDNNQGNTMGALYWQLNDVWVAPTWSGQDFNGKWKMLQYFSKEFFAPTIITGRKYDDTAFSVFATTDLIDGLNAATVVIHVYRWDSMEPAAEEVESVSLTRLRTVEIPYDLPPLLSRAGCGDGDEGRKNCFLHLHVMDADMTTLLAPTNYLFLEKLRDSNLTNANVQILSVSSDDADGKVFEVNVSTDAVALFVWLDSHDISGRFSTNGFLLVDAEVKVMFVADEATTAEELIAALTITHLRDPLYL